MTSMLERVARALCRLDGHDPDRDSTEIMVAPGQPIWLKYVPAARAALEALREPSDAELERAGVENDTSGEPYCSDFHFFRSELKLLLDAALSEDTR